MTHFSFTVLATEGDKVETSLYLSAVSLILKWRYESRSVTPISPKDMNCLSAVSAALASVAQKLDHNLNFRVETNSAFLLKKRSNETPDVGFTPGLKMVATQCKKKVL